MNAADLTLTQARDIAEQVIRDGRRLHGPTPDAFDFDIGVNGVDAGIGVLFQIASGIANEAQRAGGDLHARRERAEALWTRILPFMQEYERWCRSGSYQGWSRQSTGPLRRTDPRGEFPWSTT